LSLKDRIELASGSCRCRISPAFFCGCSASYAIERLSLFDEIEQISVADQRQRLGLT
jgi:hypothetical protein